MKIAICACAITLLIAAIARFPVKQPPSAATPPVNERVSQARKVYVLDSQNPEAFVRAHLKKVFEKPTGGLFGDDAIEKHVTVRLQSEARSADVDVLLISGLQMDTDYYYIRLIGEAKGVDDAHLLASRICSTVGIADGKVRQWVADESYNKSTANDCLQTGRTMDGCQHEITIRKSLSRDASKPWAVDYTVSFRIPQHQSTK